MFYFTCDRFFTAVAAVRVVIVTRVSSNPN